MLNIVCENYYILTILIVALCVVNNWISIKFMDVAHNFLEAGMRSANLKLVDDKWNLYRWLDMAFIVALCLLEISLLLPLIWMGALHARFTGVYYILQYSNIVGSAVMMLVLIISYLFKKVKWGLAIARHRKIFYPAMFVSAISIIALTQFSLWVD